MLITVDNSYEFFLDGQEIGRGSDWRVFIEYDLKQLLTPGEHVLAVDAMNDFDVAGMACGLRIEMEDGGVMEIVSDGSWKIAPNSEASWMEKTQVWAKWSSATVFPASFTDQIPTRIYYAPASLPREASIWQRRWFQCALLFVTGVSLLSGLFFASRSILQEREESVVRRERERIALDLHDGLGGEITQLVLSGETYRRNFDAASLEAEMLARLCDKSRGLIREMNETVWLMNSQRDNHRDLAFYIVKYAENVFHNSPIRCRFDVEDDLPPWPCDLGIRRNLFLAVKEALNNILRHSQAATAEIGIRRSRGELVVTIRDDGQGFVPSVKNVGNGLDSMRLRTEEAGGKFALESTLGRGCKIEFRVRLQVPLDMGFARLFRWMPLNRSRRGSAG